MSFSDLDVIMMLQVQACRNCGTIVNPDERRFRGKCSCGAVRSEVRMITKKEARDFVAGRLHCYCTFDGRMKLVEASHGILSFTDPRIMEHYRAVLERFAIDEEMRYNRRKFWLRKEAWAPIRYKWSPKMLTYLRRMVHARREKQRELQRKKLAAAGD